MDKTSVVISAHNEGENLVDTVQAVLEGSHGLDHEVVVVDDASTDGSGDRVRSLFKDCPVTVVQTPGLGISGARNRGAEAAEGTYLVFLDAHCYTPPGWLECLTEPLSDSSVGLVGPTFASLTHDDGARGLGIRWCSASLEMEWLLPQAGTPYPVPLLPGGCQAVRKVDFQQVGGYDEGMTRWGSEDQEFSLRMWLIGYQVVGQPAATVYHLFRDQHPYAVEMSAILHNRLRMALLHLSPPRVERVIEALKAMPELGNSIMRLMESHVMQERKALGRLRTRDDNWFFEQFEFDL